VILAEESQEVYSFLTELGVFTRTRLIQESTDSGHAFQAWMIQVFEDMLYICVLIWIDDVLVYTRSFEDLLQAQRQIQSSKDRPLVHGDHLCGRKISVAGITFDPEMIESLLSLPEPENAANL